MIKLHYISWFFFFDNNGLIIWLCDNDVFFC
nr:MAG TPA: desulfoferrodoxin [Bacteriophage sp.]